MWACKRRTSLRRRTIWDLVVWWGRRLSGSPALHIPCGLFAYGSTLIKRERLCRLVVRIHDGQLGIDRSVDLGIDSSGTQSQYSGHARFADELNLVTR